MAAVDGILLGARGMVTAWKSRAVKRVEALDRRTTTDDETSHE